MLVSRIVELLRAGHVSVDEIAVITFTEAAAAEIAARVRQELERALREAEGADQTARLHAALTGLHRARLETIHAFATNLLRERPIEAGLDPQFEVLDALAAQLAFDEAYGAWLSDLLSDSRPELARAIARGFDLKQIRQLVDAIQGNRALLPLARERAAGGDIAAFVVQARTIITELRKLVGEAAGDEKAMADIDRVIAYGEVLEAASGDAELLERAVLFNAPKFKPREGNQTHWADANDCKRCKTIRLALSGALAELQSELRTQAIVDVLPLAEAFVTTYAEQRRERGTADFDDLLLWTRELLATSPEACAYARRRFRAILVDEFQDTDPVQAEIAVRLASDDPQATDWLSMTLREGSLTVVGDPKQSIYRFRRADIAVYDAVKSGPLEGGEETLEQNFRSVAGVLGFANEVFHRVFREQAGVQPKHTELRVADAALTDESRSICVVQGTAETKADPIRKEEGRILAGTLRRVVDDGWMVRDPESGAERTARWGDITILVPRRTELDTYLEAFRKSGVPVRAESGRSFFQRQEISSRATRLPP